MARNPGTPPSTKENPVPSGFVKRKPCASTPVGRKILSLITNEKELSQSRIGRKPCIFIARKP
jgi:hypothetical protein